MKRLSRAVGIIVVSAATVFIAMLPLAVPGLVIAFGYLGCFSGAFPGTLLDPRFNPMLLLALSYAVRRLPYMVRAANASKERITIGEETVRLARKNYDQAKGMYEEGLSDYLRVLDADARLVSAERSLLEVKRSGRARERALDALQAAVLLVKLKYLDEWLDHRRANADMYSRLLANLDGVCAPFVDASGTHSFNYYTIRVSKPRLDRNGLKRHLESKGVARQFITHCLFTSKRFTGIWGTK
jgi:hypothetical protein